MNDDELERDALQEQIDAVRAMGESGDSRHISQLIEMLAAESLALRTTAEKALQQIDVDWRKSPAAYDMFPALVLMLKEPSACKRMAAAWALEQLGNPQAIDPLAAALHRSEALAKISVAQALRNLGEHHLDKLVAALKVQAVAKQAQIAGWTSLRSFAEPQCEARRESEDGGSVFSRYLLAGIRNRTIRTYLEDCEQEKRRGIPTTPDDSIAPGSSTVDSLLKLVINESADDRRHAAEELIRIGRDDPHEVLCAINAMCQTWRETCARGESIPTQGAVELMVVEMLLKEDSERIEADFEEVLVIDELVRALQTESGIVPWAVAELLGRIHYAQAKLPVLSSITLHADPLVRAAAQHAAHQHRGFVHDDRELLLERTFYVSELISDLSDADLRAAVVTALVRFGPAAIGFLVALVEGRRFGGEAVADSLWAIRLLGAPNATEHVIAALQDSDPTTRWGAAQCLGIIRDDRALETLVAALRDESSAVRCAAAESLRYYRDSRAITPLLFALEDTALHVRIAAANALELIDPAVAEKEHASLHRAVAVLQYGEWFEQCSAASAIADLRDERGIPALVSALRNEISVVRDSAAEALLGVGFDGREHLIRALEDEEEYVRFSTAVVLGAEGDPQAASVLIHMLKHEDYEGARWNAAHALGKIACREAVEPLLGALRDSNHSVVSQAATALGEIGDDRAVIALLRLFRHDEPNVRIAAEDALARIGSAALSGLTAAAWDDSWSVRRHAVRSLGKVARVESVALLGAMLKDDDAFVRQYAAEALGNIGSEQAIPILTAIINDSDSKVQTAAREALKKLEPNAS